MKIYAGRRTCDYGLCGQCKNHLVERHDDAKNVWPLFLYCLLFGFHMSVFGGSYHHDFVYSGNTLWKLIPCPVREWWIYEIVLLPDYRDCTIDYPVSTFEDKNMDCFNLIMITVQVSLREALMQWRMKI